LITAIKISERTEGREVAPPLAQPVFRMSRSASSRDSGTAGNVSVMTALGDGGKALGNSRPALTAVIAVIDLAVGVRRREREPTRPRVHRQCLKVPVKILRQPITQALPGLAAVTAPRNA